jgi:deoxyribodipyrimidine photo-lyase
MTLIWWLRRDIRLDDNAALSAAFRESGGAVVPVFVLDRHILLAPETGAARVHFLMESLRGLDRQLRERGARLIVREGKPVAELLKLCRELAAEGLFFNRDYEPYALKRDAEVMQQLSAAGLRVESFKDRLIVEPDELRSSNGRPFTVYTPYRKRWLSLVSQDATLSANCLAADRIHFTPISDSIPSLPIPTAQDLGFSTTQQVAEAGEEAAQRLLSSFVRRAAAGLREYHQQRNQLGVEGTSRLAPHLRFGTLSPRAAVRAALALRERSDDPDDRKGCETWLGELAWRDFYTGIMHHFPYVLERPYRDLFVEFPYREAPDELAAWQEGRTGYPVVDAALRQLNVEGFMHNRGRLITASFLVKDLLIDYRAGELYFLRQLTCGDYAVNNGNWQWVAGSSNDPQPYFRIFNPVTQGQTYDPDGNYVRRYVPELAAVPASYLHVELGHDYPAPIVDHKAARDRANAAFKQLRDRFYGAQAQHEAEQQ